LAQEKQPSDAKATPSATGGHDLKTAAFENNVNGERRLLTGLLLHFREKVGDF
jgi:hypothetical protein